jgi:hypothetical protein
MQEPNDLTDEQVSWLQGLLNGHGKRHTLDRPAIPDDERDALARQGLIRVWRNGDLDITLAGMVAVANRVSPAREKGDKRAA